MRGAFFVGALKTIHKMLGPDYFDIIFSTSVGAFEQALYASGQIYFMENTWREYVHGNQLIKLLNPLKGKPILDLDYLVNLFQSEKSLLDIERMRCSHPDLFAFTTDYKTREPKIMNLKEGPIFDIMRATCAIPIVYSTKVVINNKRYVDSWLTTHKKFQEILNNSLREYTEVLAITVHKNDKRLKGIKNIIKPSKMPLWWLLDTNKRRIIKTIKQGEIDTEKFIVENNLIGRV